MTVVMLIGGFIALIAGAEILVRGASKLALAFGISPLVIGLTVVAFGTSSPEMAVSAMSSLSGQGDIALGNVVGSNIFNVLLILGVSALIIPLVVAQQLIKLDVPLMIGSSLLVLILALDGSIDRVDGIILFSGIIFYTVFLIYQSKKENKAIQQEYEKEFGKKDKPIASNMFINIGLIVVGLLLLVLGSQWLVESAVSIAKHFGVSELIIGLTIIAAGTSLPEVATSVIAAVKGERDIAVGNVVGSNIFNLFAVLGIAGFIAPNGIHVSYAVLGFDIPVMTAVAIACLPVFFTGNRISRWEGGFFLFYYITYTVYLILKSNEHDYLPLFSNIVMWFVVPITLVTLAIVIYRLSSTKTKK